MESFNIPLISHKDMLFLQQNRILSAVSAKKTRRRRLLHGRIFDMIL